MRLREQTHAAQAKLARIDWPTIALAIGIYGAFALLTWFARDLAWWAILPLGAVVVCLQSSLQHEAIHGYPTPWRWVNTAIAAPSLWLWLPYGVNRIVHLQHHIDENLTDPRRDPESNYLTAAAWAEMSLLHRSVRQAMATLLGRIVIGPLYYAAQALGELLQAIRQGDRAILQAWALHGVFVAALLWWVVAVCGISFGEYLLFFAWPGTGLALIRSFAEHRAAPDAAARTATIEAGWIWRWLYLNNNLHALHHSDPTSPWHRRPAVYRQARTEILGRSRYHLVQGYGSLFRNYLLDGKEPLLHPSEGRTQTDRSEAKPTAEGPRRGVSPDQTKRPRVAVIGGGFAGAAFAIHLIRANGDRPIAIDLYEPRPLLGAGLAYSSADPAHRINVAAARMAVFSEDPTHFDRWFRETGEAAADPEALLEDGRAYPRRAAFGRYMDQLLRTAAAAFPNVTFRHWQTKVADLKRRGDAYRLITESGEEDSADVVVLSPGHPPPPSLRWASAEAARAPRLVNDPWRPQALGAIRPNDEVLIIGTGLTMADVVASLRLQGHVGPITAVSRRGLTPRPRTTLPVEAYGSFNQPPTGSAATLLRDVRQAVRAAATEGKPWECVVDALRQQGTAIWQGLSPVSRRRFLKHLRTWWDVHRYQIAPQLDQVLVENQRSGRLKIVRADIRAIESYQGSFHVKLSLRGAQRHPEAERFFDAVVNCTGPDHGTVVQSNPVLRALAASGLLRADPLGLGIDVDPNARVIAADGTLSPDLFVAGPLARGYFGELMGLPQVSLQPERLAITIAELISNQAAAPSRVARVG